MPAPAPPRKGLQPTIVDRLLDPESAGNAVITGYTVEKMYLAVRRDLEDLLNTLHPYHKFPENFPETRDSVVTYGLPDLASIEAISTEQRSHIGKLILRAIHRFEPRLKTVKVTLLKQESGSQMSVKFKIEARLTVDPAPEVAFDTILDVGTGKYEVQAQG